MRRERGLVIIIGYKLVKAGLMLLAAVVLLVGMHMGLGNDLAAFADYLRHHARAWSVALADLVVKASTHKGLWTVTVALTADGCFSGFEGWALWRAKWWAPWLIVAATSVLLPFEILEIIRKPHLVRVLVFAANVAIVVYLARKALRESALRRIARRERESAPPPPETPAPP